MKRTWVGLASLFVAAIAHPVSAQGIAPCGDSYRRDSFGRGIESAFNGAASRPRLNDERCFRAGVNHAAEVIAAGTPACKEDFSTGRSDGLAQATSESGASCYALGYDAGRADLDIAAREGNDSLAGIACVGAYRRGLADSLIQVRTEIGGPADPREPYCYELGLYEGPLTLP